MGESINLDVASSGQERVAELLRGLGQRAKEMGAAFEEVNRKASAAGDTVVVEVGEKGERAVRALKEETGKAGRELGGMEVVAGRLAKSLTALFSLDQLRRWISLAQEATRELGEMQRSASRAVVGGAFGSGDTVGSVRAGLEVAGSPLGMEDRARVREDLRGAAPNAAPGAVNEALRGLLREGAIATGMDAGRLGEVARLSGQFLERGFSPSQANDLAVAVAQMMGDQSLQTRAFGIAHLAGEQMGIGGQQATLLGLSTVMAAHRQGLRLPTTDNVESTLRAVDPGLRNRYLAGLMGSGGALSREAAEAMSGGDAGYALEVRRAVAEEDAARIRRLDGEGLGEMWRDARRAEMALDRQIRGQTVSQRGMGGFLDRMGAGLHSALEATGMQPVRIRVESDRPGVHVEAD